MDSVSSSSPPPAKRQKLDAAESCALPSLPYIPFDKNQPLPDENERKRLQELVQNSEEWQSERQKRLGASAAGPAAGLGFATPRDHWRLMTRRLNSDYDQESLNRMERGHRLEPEAAIAYQRLMNCRLGKVGIVVHPSIPWLSCSPDRIIKVGDGAGGKGIVEIKAPFYALPLQIADHYMAQVQQQLACTGADWCDLMFYFKKEGEGKEGTKCADVVEIEIWRIYQSAEYWAVLFERIDKFANCLMEDREPTVEEISLRPQMPLVRKTLVLDSRHYPISLVAKILSHRKKTRRDAKKP